MSDKRQAHHPRKSLITHNLLLFQDISYLASSRPQPCTSGLTTKPYPLYTCEGYKGYG